MKSNIKQRRILAYLDSFPLTRDLRQAWLASHKGMISLRELQSETQEELLVQHQVCVKQEGYTVPSIDAEYWSEVLGVAVENGKEQQKRK